MKNKKNIIFAIAGVILGLGIIMGGIGFMMGGTAGFYLDKDGFHAQEKNRNTKNMQVESFHSIKVLAKSASIEVIKSDHNAVEYGLSGTNDLKKCAVENGVLDVEEQFRFALTFFSGFDNHIKIYYQNPAVLENIYLETTSGRVQIQDIEGKSIELHSVSGSVKAANVSASQLSMKTTSGSVRGENITTNDVTTSTVSGSVELMDVNTHQLRASSTSGSIKLIGKFEGATSAQTVSGSIKIEQMLKQNQCDYTLESQSGSTRVNDQKFSGTVQTNVPNSIFAKTTSGSIRLNFMAG